jgi:hypothetical protein
VLHGDSDDDHDQRAGAAPRTTVTIICVAADGGPGVALKLRK